MRIILGFCLLTSNLVFANEPVENEALAIEHYNQGVKAYQEGDFRLAADKLETCVFSSLDPSTRKKALFNLGNAYFKIGEMEQAQQAYQQSLDTNTSNANFEKETNQKISDNLALLVRMKELQQKKRSDQQKEGDGEGEGKKDGKGSDPKGPKKFEDEGLSNDQKRKVFDLISEEEKQTLKRLSEDKNKATTERNLKPW